MNIKNTSIASIALSFTGFILWLMMIININLPQVVNSSLGFLFDAALIVFAAGLISRFSHLKLSGIIFIAAICLRAAFFILSFFNIDTASFFGTSDPGFIQRMVTIIFLTLIPTLFFLIEIIRSRELQQFKTTTIISLISFILSTCINILFFIMISQKFYETFSFLDGSSIFYSFYTWFYFIFELGFFGFLLFPFAFRGNKISEEEENEISQEDLNSPMTVKNWLITYVITIFPIINIIMLFVWAFGKEVNTSKKNWAKATLIWMVVVFIISALLVFLMVILSAGRYYY